MGTALDDPGRPHDILVPPNANANAHEPLSPSWGVPPTPLSPNANANPAAGPAPPRIVYAPARHHRASRYDPPKIVYMPARHEHSPAAPANIPIANPEWASVMEREREAEVRRANTLAAPPGGGVGGREERREERKRRREERERERREREVNASGVGSQQQQQQLPTPLSPVPSMASSIPQSASASQRSGSVSLDPARNMAGIGTRKLFDGASTVGAGDRTSRAHSHGRDSGRSRSRGPPPPPGPIIAIEKSVPPGSIVDVKSAHHHHLSGVPPSVAPGAPSLPPTAVFMAAPIVPGPPSVAGGHPGWGATPGAVSMQLPAASRRDSVAPSKKDVPTANGSSGNGGGGGGATSYPTPPGSASSHTHYAGGAPPEDGMSIAVVPVSDFSPSAPPPPIVSTPSRPSVDGGPGGSRRASRTSALRSLMDVPASPRSHAPSRLTQLTHDSHSHSHRSGSRGRHSVDVDVGYGHGHGHGRGRGSRKSIDTEGGHGGYGGVLPPPFVDGHHHRHQRAHSADSQLSRSSASTYYVIPTPGQKVRIIVSSTFSRTPFFVFRVEIKLES